MLVFYLCILCVLCFVWILVRGVYICVFMGKEFYVQYLKWNVCINVFLSFEFKISQGMGILMYMDDGGFYDFFELLFEGGVV